MSDFDEEAERERLREKYERDERERQATEQMSELLLQGATMTNAHCSDCGDPIFRYDGQEFCPTCEKPVDRGEDRDVEDGPAGEGDGNGARDDSVEVASPSDDARVKFGGDDPSPDEDADTDTQSEDPSADEPRTPFESSDEPTREPADSPHLEEAAGERRSAPPGGEAAQTSAGDVGSNVASARASLARTVARFARAAESTDDPAVATEYLAAAREAAEALDELD